MIRTALTCGLLAVVTIVLGACNHTPFHYETHGEEYYYETPAQ